MNPIYSQGKFDPNHPVITQSFLNMWADCAYAGFRRYVLGEVLPPGVAALQGTATDVAVTLGCNSVIETGKDASLEEKKDIAATIFERKKDEYKIESDDDLPSLKDQTIKLVTLHHNEIAPKLKPVSTQEAIKIDMGDYSLAGTMDLIEENHVIADTKTSKRKYSENAVTENLQPAVYSALYKSKYGIAPTSFRYDVLIKNKAVIAQQVSGVVGVQQELLLNHHINAALLELASGMKSGVFRLAASGHWRCESSGKWCGYLNNGCPKGKVL